MGTRTRCNQIYRLYQEKGYDLAEVKLLEGGNPGDTKVVIQIFEGPKVKIGSIDFVGSQFASPAILRTHITTRKPNLGLFGKYHSEMLDETGRSSIEYYQTGLLRGQGDAGDPTGKNPGEIELTFVDPRGNAVSVRNVIIQGNSKLKTDVLRGRWNCTRASPFLVNVRDADKNRILIKYNEIGCIDTEVSVEPRFTSEPGVVDLLYKIEECLPGRASPGNQGECRKDHD